MTATTTPSKSADAIARLEAAITAIQTSEQFTAYLATRARFHSYSFGNCVLIMAQRPDATHVAGFKRWLEMGRCVKKGEKGIQILVPHRTTVEDEATGEKRSFVRSFGVGYVFDVTQTDGEPLPAPPMPVPLDGDEPRATELETRLVALATAHGATVETETMRGAQNGYYEPSSRRIALGDTLSAAMRVKTLAHECAHLLADHDGTDNRRDAETVAEAAAYVALAAVGIDTLTYSAPYVAAWAQDGDRFRAALHEIDRVSSALIAALADAA